MQKRSSNFGRQKLVTRKLPNPAVLSGREVEVINEIFEAVKINQSELARILEKSPSAISAASRGKRQILSRENIGRLTEILKKIGSQLVTFNPEKDDLFDFCQRTGLREAWIAEQIGISRQALNESKRRGFSDDRLDEIRSVVRSAGRTMLEKTKRIPI